MWRKQDQPKPSSSATETPVPAVVESPVTAPVTAPTSSSEPTQEFPPANSRLTAALRIKGEITGREDVLIDGKVEGRIEIEGATLTVGPDGGISADIEANEIIVRGNVQGSLQAHGRVRVGATGKMQGKIAAHGLVVEDGAEIRGSVETIRMDKSVGARSVAPTIEEIAVPQPVRGAPPLAKEPSAAA
jgi:cytoskeletal protein CcmA (bactofilin family)